MGSPMGRGEKETSNRRVKYALQAANWPNSLSTVHLEFWRGLLELVLPHTRRVYICRNQDQDWFRWSAARVSGRGTRSDQSQTSKELLYILERQFETEENAYSIGSRRGLLPSLRLWCTKTSHEWIRAKQSRVGFWSDRELPLDTIHTDNSCQPAPLRHTNTAMEHLQHPIAHISTS